MSRWVLVFILSLGGSEVRRAPAADWEYAVTYRGKPVAGAKVGLTVHNYSAAAGPNLVSGPAFSTSDAAGVVRFPAAAAAGAVGRFLARDADGRGGYGTLYGAAQRYPLTLELYESAKLTGSVTDAAGKPVAGLTLAPAALGPESFTRFGGRFVTLADTPDWFWESFPVTIAADGSFTLTGVPVGHSVAVRFAAPGYGSGRFWVQPGKPAVVKLDRAGATRVGFTTPAGAKVTDIAVSATRTPTPRDGLLEVTATGTAKAGADLTLPDLPPGTYQISFPHTGPAAHFPKAVAPVVVKPGETAEVRTPLEPAARLLARFVDSKTGRGVPNAELIVNVSRGSGPGENIPGYKSDADGKVEVAIPAGMASATPRAAEGFAVVRFSSNRFNSYATEPVPVAAGKSHDFGTFALVKTVDITGTVTDADGKPVAGATVLVGYSGTNFGSGKPVKSAANGSFVIEGMNPEGGLFGVTAKKGNAVTAAPVAVDPGKPVGEINVVISEKFAARVRVRAVNGAGRPVAAVVELTRSVTYLVLSGGAVGSGISTRAGVTADDGRFESAVLQPGDTYTLSLSAPGHRGATTEEWVAKPGETHDFGALVLTRADVNVSGTVTDTAGKPVPGAKVFSNADGPRPTETKADAGGKFTLGGLYEGTAFISATADGFRLATVPAEAGGPPARISLRRPSDPPAPPPAQPAGHADAEAKLAGHLLTAMWANRVAANDGGKVPVRAMARLDPATARAWRDEEKERTGGKNDLTPEIAAVQRDVALFAAAKDDPDEAVALLKTSDGVRGFRAVCDLAKRLLPVAPDKALRIAEEAVARSRGLPENDRAWTLAEAGELVYEAGRKDAGRALIAEAATAAVKFGYDGLDGYRRGMVACRVALYDPAKARAMIDPIPTANDFNRWLAEACARCVTSDLPRAKTWLADFRPDNTFSRHSSRQMMAYRLARTAPSEAVALAESIEDSTVRAVTLAGVAVRVTDKSRAVAAVDSAVDRIVANPNGYFRNNGGGGGTAALVLYRAKQIGHPDLAFVRDKVLAARSAPNTGPFGRSIEADVRLALALALTDPATARAILGRAVPPGVRTKLHGPGDRDVLIALALADPSGATAAVDGTLKRIVAEKKGFEYSGLDTLAALLTEPDRRYEMALRTGGLFGEFAEE